MALLAILHLAADVGLSRHNTAKISSQKHALSQGPGRRTTEDFKDLRHTGKAVAKDCHLPPLRVIVVDEAFSCTVQQLWHIICKPDPSFQSTIHRLSNNREIQYGGWHQEGMHLAKMRQIAAQLSHVC